MNFDFFSSETFHVILSLAIGFGSKVVSGYVSELLDAKRLESIERLYPALDIFFSIASQVLKSKRPGLILEGAKEILKDEKLSPKEVTSLAKLLVKGFDLDVYAGLDFTQFKTADIERGEAVAKALIPEFSSQVGAQSTVQNGRILIGE